MTKKIRVVRRVEEYLDVEIEDTLDWQDNDEDYETVMQQVSDIPVGEWISTVTDIDIYPRED